MDEVSSILQILTNRYTVRYLHVKVKKDRPISQYGRVKYLFE